MHSIDVERQRTGARRWAAVVLAACSLGGATMAAAPGAAHAGSAMNQVGGVADFNDPNCPGLSLNPSETGWSLDGCLQITGFEREKFNPSGTYQEEGTEQFVGDLYVDGVYAGSGTFDTTFQFRAKFEEIGNFDTKIFGRCQHPIVSGTGVFAGVEGRLDFKDVVDGPGAPFAPYRGHMRI